MTEGDSRPDRTFQQGLTNYIISLLILVIYNCEIKNLKDKLVPLSERQGGLKACFSSGLGNASLTLEFLC